MDTIPVPILAANHLEGQIRIASGISTHAGEKVLTDLCHAFSSFSLESGPSSEV
jgi:hypothetical protein